VSSPPTNNATVTIADDDTPTPTTPTVTISATDPNASKPGSDTGTFAVSRTGATSGALTVNYSVGGTATNGTDYTMLSGSVVIPDGQPSANIRITARNDTTPEPPETVVVRLIDGTGYTVGSPPNNSAQVTINDDNDAGEALTINGINPTSGLLTGGTFVVIAGKGFEAGATMKIGGISGSVISATNTQIRAITGRASVSGFSDVLVTNPGGQSAVLSNGFNYESSPSYYFAQIAAGGRFRTTFIYVNVNVSAQPVSCTTFFYANSGDLLDLVVDGLSSSMLLRTIPVGGTVRIQTDANPSAPVVTGWARADCSGPIKASALFRDYPRGVAAGEASVIAMTRGATSFVTFADQLTGVAYANPSIEAAEITFTANDLNGVLVGQKPMRLDPNAHGSDNVGHLLGVGNFKGSLRISSSVPIISLSLNYEAAPVFSALSPGEEEPNQ